MSDGDHDLLIRIDERVEKILHEIKIQNGRIRSLEKWQWMMAGGVTVITIVFGGKLFLF